MDVKQNKTIYYQITMLMQSNMSHILYTSRYNAHLHSDTQCILTGPCTRILYVHWNFIRVIPRVVPSLSKHIDLSQWYVFREKKGHNHRDGPRNILTCKGNTTSHTSFNFTVSFKSGGICSSSGLLSTTLKLIRASS